MRCICPRCGARTVPEAYTPEGTYYQKARCPACGEESGLFLWREHTPEEMRERRREQKRRYNAAQRDEIAARLRGGKG